MWRLFISTYPAPFLAAQTTKSPHSVRQGYFYAVSNFLALYVHRRPRVVSMSFAERLKYTSNFMYIMYIDAIADTDYQYMRGPDWRKCLYRLY